MAKIKITQIKSTIDRPKDQKATIVALGLGRISKSKVVENTRTKVVDRKLDMPFSVLT